VRNCTNDDAVAFVGFLDRFANALHDNGMELTVDAATWSPFWNFTLLSTSHVDRVILMVRAACTTPG